MTDAGKLAPLSEYRTLVFDCDGVILDSNRIKTAAFYEAASRFGTDAAQALVDYHVANGGISRYQKFEHFFDSIYPECGLELSAISREYEMAKSLNLFSQIVRAGLRNCAIAEGLRELRLATPNACWMIVSGSDQAELRSLFAVRHLDQFFDGGIFGSPATKDSILQCNIKSRNLSLPALFLGDSKYDYIAARKHSLDFLFLHEWTEVQNWEVFTYQNRITALPTLNDLLPKDRGEVT